MPARHRLPGQRDVDLLLRQAALEILTREPGLAVGNGLLELLPQRVEDATGFGIAHLSKRLLQRALPPEVANSHRRAQRGRSARNRACASFSRPWTSTDGAYHRADELL